MGTVTRGAVCYRPITSTALKAVIGIDIGLQATRRQVVLLVQLGRIVTGRTGNFGHPEGTDGRARIIRSEDAVFTVTRGAGRGIHFTAGYEFTMDARLVLLLDSAVALPASRRDIEEVDGRLEVARRQDAVGRTTGGVTIVAGSGGIHTTGCGLAVHALLVNLYGMLELDVQAGQEFLVLMAGPAGSGQVGCMNQGFGIRVRQNMMTAVALLAGRNLVGFPDGTPAVLDIDFDRFLMTDAAIGLGQVQGMREPLDIVMAIGAGKILMDTAPQISRRDFGGNATGIGVTIGANLVREIDGQGRRYHNESGQKQRGEKYPCSYHLPETFPWTPAAEE